MKFTSITQFKQFLAEAYSAQDARDTFEGVLSPAIITDIESKFKIEYGTKTANDSIMYYIVLKDQSGRLIDRIVYQPSSNIDAPEWWTAASTATEKPLNFLNWNQLVEWFNSNNTYKLPLLKL